MSKFEVYKDRGNEYRFRLKAGNGEIILQSEGYVNKSGANNGVQSVRDNAPYDSRYEKKQTASGQYMFNLKAANGQVIGTSEQYTTALGRDNGIESVKRNAPTATLIDLT